MIRVVCAKTLVETIVHVQLVGRSPVLSFVALTVESNNWVLVKEVSEFKLQ